MLRGSESTFVVHLSDSPDQLLPKLTNLVEIAEQGKLDVDSKGDKRPRAGKHKNGGNATEKKKPKNKSWADIVVGDDSTEWKAKPKPKKVGCKMAVAAWAPGAIL